MTEVYPTALEDAQNVRHGQLDHKPSNSFHDVETAKGGATEIEILAANIDPVVQSRYVLIYFCWYANRA